MRLRTIFAVLSLLGSSAVHSATAYWATGVDSVLIDDSNYGGCMILLSNPPSAQAGLNCPAPFATLSCDGEFSSKTEAQTKLNGAQLAMVTDTVVGVRVDDARKVPGTNFCFVERIDLSTTPNP